MDFNDVVKNNKQIIDFVNAWPGRTQPFHIKKDLLLTPYVGTLDIASARLNSILIRLSEHPLLKSEYEQDVKICNEILNKFFRTTLKLRTWPKIFIPFFKWRLKRIGVKHIPKIKATYKAICKKTDDKR